MVVYAAQIDGDGDDDDQSLSFGCRIAAKYGRTWQVWQFRQDDGKFLPSCVP